jgi:hypothetical protein
MRQPAPFVKVLPNMSNKRAKTLPRRWDVAQKCKAGDFRQNAGWQYLLIFSGIRVFCRQTGCVKRQAQRATFGRQSNGRGCKCSELQRNGACAVGMIDEEFHPYSCYMTVS